MCQDEFGTVVEEDFVPLYCYNAEDSSACGAENSCGLPGKRHGYSMINAVIGGSTEVVMMFGGQKTGFHDEQAELTSDVHIISFGSVNANAIKVPIDCSDATMCPAPRRDAAAALMKDGLANGKLVVFGGMACPGASPGESCSNNPIKVFLDNNVDAKAAPTALNDLWYLDLNLLDEDCVKEAWCYVQLTWVQIEVPGSKPTKRWGAGLVIDNLDNLFVTVCLYQTLTFCVYCDFTWPILHAILHGLFSMLSYMAFSPCYLTWPILHAILHGLFSRISSPRLLSRIS